MKKILYTLVFAIIYGANIAQVNTRINKNWEFVKGDLGSVWEAFRPKELSQLPQWEPVQIPHCFNAFDAVDPDVKYYQGPCWYKTSIEVINPIKNGRTVLHFEGSGQKTEVYVYTTKVASHVGGYDEFYVDITDAIKKFRAANPMDTINIPIAIRCDNSRDTEMIPSDLSDFNIYGGLYRYVNLVYLPEISLQQVYFNYTLDTKYKNAEIKLTSELNTPILENTPIELEIILTDASAKIVSTLKIKDGTWKGIKEIAVLNLKNPTLWSPKNPYLYTLEVKITASGSTHSLIQRVGFTHVVFETKGPLKINGERLLLRGTHRHEDHAGVGAAMTESQIRSEMLMMKDMGVNFIRLGHYQQSRIVLDLCDSLGFFVWEEIPWCRGGLGGDVYKEQGRRMLTNMIKQHQNHASILIWGLGNENDWPGDFAEFDKEKIRQYMSELHNLSHELDPERKTSIRRCDFCKDIVDVYSPSIWAGWYRGNFTQYKDFSYNEAMSVDHFLHVEWGADHHAGRHSENPYKGLNGINADGVDERQGDFLMTGGDPRASKDGDWSETYACNLIDWHLKEQETMDWLTGTAYWPFKDFSTPIRPENPVPYVNQKGVVQRDLTPKESFYVFQSYWTEKPMAHIYGHTWETRWGEPIEDKFIKVYSNCTEAELFLNGKSMGTRKRNSQDYPAAGLRWKVQFLEGENHIKVLAQKDGLEVIDEISFTYQTQGWGSPAYFKIEEIDRVGDTITVRANVYDKDGVFCPDSKELVEFEIVGNGELIDNLGTNNGSRKIQLYNGKADIKVKLESGNTIVSVKSKIIKAAFVNIGN